MTEELYWTPPSGRGTPPIGWVTEIVAVKRYWNEKGKVGVLVESTCSGIGVDVAMV